MDFVQNEEIGLDKKRIAIDAHLENIIRVTVLSVVFFAFFLFSAIMFDLVIGYLVPILFTSLLVFRTIPYYKRSINLAVENLTRLEVPLLDSIKLIDNLLSRSKAKSIIIRIRSFENN